MNETTTNQRINIEGQEISRESLETYKTILEKKMQYYKDRAVRFTNLKERKILTKSKSQIGFDKNMNKVLKFSNKIANAERTAMNCYDQIEEIEGYLKDNKVK